MTASYLLELHADKITTRFPDSAQRAAVQCAHVVLDCVLPQPVTAPQPKLSQLRVASWWVAGFTTVAGVLNHGALAAWTAAGRALGSVAQTTPTVTSAMLEHDEATVIDVRSRDKWAIVAPERVEFFGYDWRRVGGWNLAFIAGGLLTTWLILPVLL